ncbi:hypothetical protein VIGAN_02030800, partial [Vigna angularis var. angularis]
GGEGGGGDGGSGWRCRGHGRRKGHDYKAKKKEVYEEEEYRLGEYAECKGRTRCWGMRLECPLHCGGPCFYDCHNFCKAHCHQT